MKILNHKQEETVLKENDRSVKPRPLSKLVDVAPSTGDKQKLAFKNNSYAFS